jgi:hypothetical protein
MLNDKTLYTPTMAKVLEAQGYLKEAAEIYSRLLDEMPGHKAFRNKLEDIQRRLAKMAENEDRLPALFEEWLALASEHRQLKRLKALQRRVSPGADEG